MPKQSQDVLEVKARKRKIEHNSIDLEELEKVARLHATMADIAEWFRCSISTLNNDPYYSVIIKARNDTKQKLKQKALQRALEDGSDSMLKFCLTNYCGWSDKVVNQVENTDNSQNGFTISLIPPKSE